MESKYLGMTVNERLYVSGVMEQFEKAIEERDIEKLIAILKKVELNEASIRPIWQITG